MSVVNSDFEKLKRYNLAELLEKKDANVVQEPPTISD